MMMNYYGGYSNYGWGYGFHPFAGILAGMVGFVIIPLLIWSIFWKGWALWKAARQDSKVWFIVLLIVNTVGILEILYIFVFSKMSQKAKKTSRSRK